MMEARDILDLREQLLQVWSKAHGQWREVEDYYDQRHKVRVPLMARVRKLGLAASKIQSMVDTLVTNEPKVTRRPLKEGVEHKARADKVEKWAAGVLRRLAASQDVIPPFRAMATYLALDGYANFAAAWDDQCWKPRPKRGEGRGYQRRLEEWETGRAKAFPLVLRGPHPARILLPPLERQPSLAIESFTASVRDMAALMPEDRQGELRGNPFTAVEGVLYWDKEVQALVVDGRLAYEKENILGMVPYAQAYAGQGFERSPTYHTKGTPGEPSLGPGPEELAQGLLHHVLGSLKALDEWNTAMQFAAMLAVYQPLLTTGDAEEMARLLQEADMSGVIPVDRLDELRRLEPPKIEPWILQTGQISRMDVDQGTFAGEVAGERTPGVTTATQHALILGSARMRFGLPMLQLNYLASLALEYFARMVVARGEVVTVGGIQVRPDDFEDSYEFEVNFLAKDEAALLRERAMLLTEKREGMRSVESALEAGGVSDTSGEMRRIWLEQNMADPELMATVREAVDSEFRKRHRMGPRVGRGPAPGPGIPGGFVAQPGGPQEQGQVMAQMGQVPGEGIERAGM